MTDRSFISSSDHITEQLRLLIIIIPILFSSTIIMSHPIFEQLNEFWFKWRSSRALILFIVFVALFLDNMLLTTVGKFFE